MDGTVLIAAGSALASGFGAETIKTVVTTPAAGRWWFLGLCLAGLGLAGWGFARRSASRRRLLGIVVTAADPTREAGRGRQLNEQAEKYVRESCSAAFKVSAQLSADPQVSARTVDEVAAKTMLAMTMAESLSPAAAAVALVPTMPLHAAFRLGARIGHTHARRVTVHALRQGDGAPAYFAAVVLRAADTARAAPLTVEPLELLPGGEESRVALAVDLQGRGPAFFEPVRAACQRSGVGLLLPVRSRTQVLAQDEETYAGAVQQICQAWRDAPFPPAARMGRRAVFLSGPVAIAVALGARLAANEPTRWTPYGYDGSTGQYRPWGEQG
jgi:hypothetical protein